MTLIAEAGFERNLRDRPIGGRDLSNGPRHTQALDVRSDGLSESLPEGMSEVTRMDTRDPCDVRQTGCAAPLIVQQSPNASQPAELSMACSIPVVQARRGRKRRRHIALDRQRASDVRRPQLGENARRRAEQRRVFQEVDLVEKASYRLDEFFARMIGLNDQHMRAFAT